MLQHILKPALIVYPYIGFSFEAERLDDDMGYVAQVVQSHADELKVVVLNGSLNLSFDKDGVITSSMPEGWTGRSVYLQWQGFKHSHLGTGDLFRDMMDHAQVGVRSGRTGPLNVRNLATTKHLKQLPLTEAAQRLEHLGDGRLSRFLAAEYPQLKTTK